MPTVTIEKLKGNYGASLVAAKLSTMCLVRPVAADTDVGVDLYCETVQGGKPFLHFWVQVKTGNQCKEHLDGKVSCQFDEGHLQYWDRQPVPVFAALVPTHWPPPSEPPIHIVEITTCRLNGNSSNTLYASLKWDDDIQTHVDRFLRETVPEATAMQSIRRGVISSIPLIHRAYEELNPNVPVEKYEDAVLKQLRKTAAMSVIFLWEKGALNCPDSDFRRRLVKVLDPLLDLDKGHWDSFMAVALSYHADREYTEAERFYEKALECIRCDGNLQNKDLWQRHEQDIEEQLKRAKECAPVGYPCQTDTPNIRPSSSAKNPFIIHSERLDTSGDSRPNTSEFYRPKE